MLKVSLLLALCLITNDVSSWALPLNDSSEKDNFIDLSGYGEMLYGLPDNNTGYLLEAVNENNIQNPEELGAYFEGDILIPEWHTDSETRNGILTKSSRWPNAIVPYEIKGPFSSSEIANIRHAFNEYHTKTCVRFKPRTIESDYISIVNSKSGCWSGIGRLGGRQEVNLQSPICLRTYGTPIHELMHVLGFFHEQNRYERDEYIKVLSDNIKPGMMINFKKSNSKEMYAFGVPYDYASVMHYSATSFSKNGKPTLIPLYNTNEAKQMGQRYGFSPKDLQKINAMYRCK